MATANHSIDVLNKLIETTLDSADGYRSAAQSVENASYTDYFGRWSAARMEVVRKLQEEVRRLGGNPEDDGSVLAAMHRGWLKLKSSLTAGDRAVIEEVERGEDVILHQFQDALKDMQLDRQTRAVIEQCFPSIKGGHDEARDLKRVHAAG